MWVITVKLVELAQKAIRNYQNQLNSPCTTATTNTVVSHPLATASALIKNLLVRDHGTLSFLLPCRFAKAVIDN